MSKKTEALIYKPTKNAMQSGYVSKNHWELKYLHVSKVKLDPLMGWAGSSDTKKQIIANSIISIISIKKCFNSLIVNIL